MPAIHHVFRNTLYKSVRSSLKTVVCLVLGRFVRLQGAKRVNCHKTTVPFHRKPSSQGLDEVRTLAKEDLHGVVLSEHATQYLSSPSHSGIHDDHRSRFALLGTYEPDINQYN